MNEPIKYQNLKYAYKIEAKSPSLFNYLLTNNELTKKHLELLESL